jgi:hypothetical protein
MKTSSSSRSAGFDHVSLGLELFWEQEDPQEYEGEGWGTHPCAVCGGSADSGSSVCGSSCYRIWVSPSEEV